MSNSSTASTHPPHKPSAQVTRRQRFLITACLIVMQSLLIAPQMHHNDFDQYWSGAKIFLHHGDPYNPIALFALERAAGSPASRVVMLMVPPWTLPLIAPLGFVPYGAARVLWFALGLLLLFASAEILWDCYGNRRFPAWLPLVLALAYVPNSAALIDGQILPLILFSLAAFLALSKTRHQVLTGISLLGFGIKPHLTYLVILAAGIWLFQSRRWTTMLTSIAALACLCGITWMVAPSAFVGYRAAAIETSVVVSGFGGLLRSIFGMQHYWLQFTPLIPGMLWFAWYRRRLAGWDWNRHLPVLLLASITMCVYGWWYDQSLLTVALVPGVIAWKDCTPQLKRWLLFGFVAVLALHAATPIFTLRTAFYVWTAPALALLYFIATRRSSALSSAAVPVPSHNSWFIR